MAKADVPNNIEDSILKTLTDIFKDDVLNFFGVKGKIVSSIQTELKDVQVTTLLLDRAFLLDDGSIFHLEFQTTNKSDDIKRFMAYDALLSYKEDKNVNTVVVYSSDIKDAKTSLNVGSINYNVKACYMHNFDGDKTFEILKFKIKNGENLTRQDIVSFGFLPLMKSKKNKNELAIEAIKVAKEAQQREDVKDTLTLMYALFQKFVSNDYMDKMKEAFGMTVLGTMLKEDGRLEEKIKIAKELLDVLDVETIAKKTGLTIDEVQKLKEEAN